MRSIIKTVLKHKKALLILLAVFITAGSLALGVQKFQQAQQLQLLINSTIKHMVFVKGGTFQMGDVGYIDEKGRKQYFAGDADVFPVHQVTLSSYSMQAYETTFGDYDIYTNYIGRDLVAKSYRGEPYTTPTHPAKDMTWYEAREYCQWLGEQIKHPMDLPTEAQWEYAARSRGLAVAYATNNGKFERGINIRDSKEFWHPMPVGSWPPNPLGMYDMTGNVAEWTIDNWHVYRDKPLIDPRYDEYVPNRAKVTRGFGVIGATGGIKLYKRILVPPEGTGGGNGIRCVVNHPEALIAVPASD